jgi:hypothetical protein
VTTRTQRPAESRSQVIDFTSLTCAAAVARVRQLASQGLPDGTLAAMFGWNRSDIRRAITPPAARPREQT